MPEPTYAELAQQYAQALAIIDRLQANNAALRRALLAFVLSTREHNAVAEHVLTTDCRWRFRAELPAAQALLAKTDPPA